jgi:hypothetical protein
MNVCEMAGTAFQMNAPVVYALNPDVGLQELRVQVQSDL